MNESVIKSLPKTHVIMGCLWLAILPWLSGGREPAAVLISSFGLLAAAFLAWRLPDRPRLGLNLLTGSALALTGWSLLSLLWSVNRYQSWRFIALLALAIVAFGVAYRFAGRWQALSLWFNGYLAIAVAFSLVGFWFYLTGQYPRLTSTFYWANPYAAYLLPAVVLSLWYYSSSGARPYLAGSVIVTAAFILTDSRSSFLTLILIGLATVFSLRRPGKFWLRLSTAIVLTITLSSGLGLYRQRVLHQTTIAPGSRFAEAAKGESNSRTDRWYYLLSSAAIWRDHPLTGTGAGTYGSAHPHYQLRVISASSHAHNFYAQSLAELGLVGGGLIALTVVGLLQGAWRQAQADRRWRPLAVVLFAMLLHWGLDIDTSYPAIVFLTAGLAGVTYRPPPAAKRHQSATGIYPLLMLVMAGLAAIPVTSLFLSQSQAARAAAAQTEADYGSAIDWYGLARSHWLYNPDLLAAEGINRLALAHSGHQREANLQAAADLAQAAASQDRLDGQHYFLLGRVKRAQGDLAAAGEAYARAIAADPYNDPNYYTDLTLLEIERKDFEAALKTASAGLQLYTDQALAGRLSDESLPQQVSDLYAARAVAYLKLDRRPQASADITKALKLNPKNDYALQLEHQK